MDLKEIGWKGVDWINLAEDSDKCQSLCERDDAFSGSILCGECLD